MLVFAWLLWGLVLCALGGPVRQVPWSEKNAASRPPFHRLPMFLSAPRPLLAPGLLRPFPYRRVLDAELTSLLLPDPHLRVPAQGASARAVEVRCGTETISVRLDRISLRAWSDPDRFRLGSCEASRVTSRFIYFHRSLTECGGEVQVHGAQLVYIFPLHYVIPPQGLIIRVPTLHLPIHCQYNRFHYSYKVGFRPHVQHAVFLKSLERKLTFSLTVHNSQWEPLPPDHVIFLGDRLYFIAQAGTLLDGERLYVDSCYATSSSDQFSLPRVDVITNFGCMSDSRREGSTSQFLQRRNNVVTFSVDVFLFKSASQTPVSAAWSAAMTGESIPSCTVYSCLGKVQYLHCSMSLGWAMSYSSKACNYNMALGRWEELEEQNSPSSVCSCCDSVCGDTLPPSNTVSSPSWFIEHEEGVKTRLKMKPVQADDGREGLNHTRNRKEGINIHVEDQTFQRNTETRHQDEEVEFFHEENVRRRLSVSQQTNEEEDQKRTKGLIESGGHPTINLSFEKEKDVDTDVRSPYDKTESRSVGNKRSSNVSENEPTSSLKPTPDLGIFQYNISNMEVFKAVPSTDCLKRKTSCMSADVLEHEKGSNNTELHANKIRQTEDFYNHVKSDNNDLTSVSEGLPHQNLTLNQSDSQSDGLSSFLWPEQLNCGNQSEDMVPVSSLGNLHHVKGSASSDSGSARLRDGVCGDRYDTVDEERGLHFNQFSNPGVTSHTSSSFNTEVMNEGNTIHSAVVSLPGHDISSQLEFETARTN